jgi:hypothetical protein
MFWEKSAAPKRSFARAEGVAVFEGRKRASEASGQAILKPTLWRERECAARDFNSSVEKLVEKIRAKCKTARVCSGLVHFALLLCIRTVSTLLTTDSLLAGTTTTLTILEQNAQAS